MLPDPKHRVAAPQPQSRRGREPPGRASVIEDYCVRLDAFEGPLDLLLHLIRRAEVEVHDIPVP